MKRIALFIALFAASSIGAGAAAAPAPVGPVGYTPFSGTWSCATSNGSQAFYTFAVDGAWLQLHTDWANGNVLSKNLNRYFRDATGAWTAVQTGPSGTTFQGTSPGWQNAQPWNTPSLSFEGTEQTPQGSQRAKQTWVMAADGSLQHIWSVWNSDAWVQTSDTNCIKQPAN